jgi:hypothetical protein
MEAGAVYRPELDRLPALGERLHVTSVLPEPLTVAVKSCVPPPLKLTLPGVTETETVGVGFRVKVALADLPVSATGVAVIVTVCWLAMDAGAVYSPVAESVPTAGVRVQVTAVLADPVTTAVNCCVALALKLTLPGLTEMLKVWPCAVKFAVWLAPLMVTGWLPGVNVNPLLLGVTV